MNWTTLPDYVQKAWLFMWWIVRGIWVGVRKIARPSSNHGKSEFDILRKELNKAFDKFSEAGTISFNSEQNGT